MSAGCLCAWAWERVWWICAALTFPLRDWPAVVQWSKALYHCISSDQSKYVKGCNEALWHWRIMIVDPHQWGDREDGMLEYLWYRTTFLCKEKLATPSGIWRLKCATVGTGALCCKVKNLQKTAEEFTFEFNVKSTCWAIVFGPWLSPLWELATRGLI